MSDNPTAQQLNETPNNLTAQVVWVEQQPTTADVVPKTSIIKQEGNNNLPTVDDLASPLVKISKKRSYKDDLPPLGSALWVDQPLVTDILCGRGGSINKTQGNVQFREKCSELRSTYLGMKRQDKPQVGKDIVNWWKETVGGRFLKKDSASNMWYEISDEHAIEKALQLLREKKSGVVKRKMEVKDLSPTGSNSIAAHVLLTIGDRENQNPKKSAKFESDNAQRVEPHYIDSAFLSENDLFYSSQIGCSEFYKNLIEAARGIEGVPIELKAKSVSDKVRSRYPPGRFLKEIDGKLFDVGDIEAITLIINDLLRKNELSGSSIHPCFHDIKDLKTLNQGMLYNALPNPTTQVTINNKVTTEPMEHESLSKTIEDSGTFRDNTHASDGKFRETKNRVEVGNNDGSGPKELVLQLPNKPVTDKKFSMKIFDFSLVADAPMVKVPDFCYKLMEQFLPFLCESTDERNGKTGLTCRHCTKRKDNTDYKTYIIFPENLQKDEAKLLGHVLSCSEVSEECRSELMKAVTQKSEQMSGLNPQDEINFYDSILQFIRDAKGKDNLKVLEVCVVD